MRLACAGPCGQINFVLVCIGASRERQKRCASTGGGASRRPGLALQPSQSRKHMLLLQGLKCNCAFYMLYNRNRVGREILLVLVALTWEFDNDVYFKIQTNHSTLVILILFIKKLKQSTTIHLIKCYYFLFTSFLILSPMNPTKDA